MKLFVSFKLLWDYAMRKIGTRIIILISTLAVCSLSLVGCAKKESEYKPKTVYYYDSHQDGDLEYEYYMEFVSKKGINGYLVNEEKKIGIVMTKNSETGSIDESGSSIDDKYSDNKEITGESDRVAEDLYGSDGVRVNEDNDSDEEQGGSGTPNVFEYSVSSELGKITDSTHDEEGEIDRHSEGSNSGETGSNGESGSEMIESEAADQLVSDPSGDGYNERADQTDISNENPNEENVTDADHNEQSINGNDSIGVSEREDNNEDSDDNKTNDEKTDDHSEGNLINNNTDNGLIVENSSDDSAKGDNTEVSIDKESDSNNETVSEISDGSSAPGGSSDSNNDSSEEVTTNDESENPEDKTEQTSSEEDTVPDGSIVSLEYEGKLGEYIWGEYPDLSELHIFAVKNNGEKEEITDYNINMNYPELSPMKKLSLYDIDYYDEDRYCDTYVPGEYYATVWYGDTTVEIPYDLNIYYICVNIDNQYYCTNYEEHKNPRESTINEDPNHPVCSNCYKFEYIFGEGSRAFGIGNTYFVPLYYDYYLSEDDLEMYNFTYGYDQHWNNIPASASKDSATYLGEYRYRAFSYIDSITYIPEDK